MLDEDDMRGAAGSGRFGYEENIFFVAFVVLLVSTEGGRGEVEVGGTAAVVERRNVCTATDIFSYGSTVAGATHKSGGGGKASMGGCPLVFECRRIMKRQ